MVEGEELGSNILHVEGAALRFSPSHLRPCLCRERHDDDRPGRPVRRVKRPGRGGQRHNDGRRQERTQSKMHVIPHHGVARPIFTASRRREFAAAGGLMSYGGSVTDAASSLGLDIEFLRQRPPPFLLLADELPGAFGRS